MPPPIHRRPVFSPRQFAGLSSWYDVSAKVDTGNMLSDSKAWTSGWSLVGTTTRTGGQADPFGGTDAILLQNFNGATGERFAQYRAGIPVVGRIWNAYVWVKGAGSDIGKPVQILLKRSAGTSSQVAVTYTLTADWVKVPIVGWSPHPTNLGFGLAFQCAATATYATSVYLFAPQVGDSQWDQAYVQTLANPIYPNAFTFTGTNTVLNLRDLSGNIQRDVYVNAAANQPTLQQDGLSSKPVLVFNGTNNYLKSLAYTSTQPKTVYLVVKQDGWTTGDAFMDGATVNSMRIYQSVSSPQVHLYAGTALLTLSNFPVGQWGVLTAIVSGARSVFQHDGTTHVTGSIGTTNPGGVTLGSYASVDANFAACSIAEVIVYDGTHCADQRLQVQQYLHQKWGIPM